MKLVCITGIDGTGKTTLARNTAAALGRRGLPAVAIYGRTYPVLSRALMALGRAAMLRGKDQWRDYAGYTADKKRTMRNPLLATTYTAAILLDYYLQLWLKLLPHLFSGRVVVSDRYLYDTIISDLAVHLGYTAAQTARAIALGLRALPMPLLTVLVDVPEEVAFARKDDVPHIDYLRERRPWYAGLRDRPEVIPFDGQQPPLALAERLADEVAARCAPDAQGVAR
jgi:thymidylate kinase